MPQKGKMLMAERLSDEVQMHILELAKTDMSMREIGRVVGVARGSVSRVVKNHGTVRLQRRGVTNEGQLYEEYKCGGCGRLIRLRECITCRDRKALGIKPE